MSRFSEEFRNLWRLASGLTMAAIVFLLFIDALDADWTWNPFYDLFFAREQGFLFYEAHGSSILAVLIFAVLAAVIESRGLRKIRIVGPVLGVFCVISIHETGWYIVGNTLGFDSGISESFAIILLALMILSFLVSRTRYLKVWIAQALFIIPLEFLNPLALHLPASNIGFLLTSAVYYLPSNAFEVGSWIIPLLFWLPWWYLTFSRKVLSPSSSRFLSDRIIRGECTRSS